MSRRSRVLLTLVLSAPALLAQEDPAETAYRIGPQDLLEIRVFEESSLNVERRVERDGRIELPLLGALQVGGLTPDEAAERLKRALEADFLQKATVDVLVTEYRSRPISVIGAVRSPGPLHLSGDLTLLEAITEAGGVSDNHGTEIHVLRRADNGLSDRLEIPVDGLIDRGDPLLDIPIFANDLINVPPIEPLTVLFLGEVAVTGAKDFSAREGITVLDAIVRAGGLTDRASKSFIIRRRLPDGSIVEIPVRYKRILEGRDPDIPLQDGDMIVVKESFF